MRTAVTFFIGILTTTVVVGLGAGIAQNSQSQQFALLGASIQAGEGWVVAGATTLGFLLAFLLLIPGRLASAWRSGTASRQAQALE